MTQKTQPSAKRPSRAVPIASTVTAVLIVATLGLAVAGKLMGPDENKMLFGTEILLDYAVAGAEIFMILLVLALHRRKIIWPVVTVMFAGFFGYASYWTLSEGKPCGCFGELWEPPLGVSMGIDAVFVLAGLVFTFLYGGRAALLGLSVFASIGAGAGGYFYAYNHSPEKALDENDGVSTPVRFLQSEMMDFAQKAPDDAPAYMLFLHEIGCHVCEEYKRDMDLFGDALESREDELLRIRSYSFAEIEEQAGIEIWEWPMDSPPFVFVVQYGVIVEPVPGDPTFEKSWHSGEATPMDIIRQTYEFMGGDYMMLEDEVYAAE